MLAAEEIRRMGFMYISPCLLNFKHFLDVFRSVFKLLHIFGLSVSIELFLSRCICDLVNSWRLLPIFEDVIKPIYWLDIDMKVVN